MPYPGFIRGTHHLTFCVGEAQPDYDFHARLLGLKSVKKTVRFDGEIPTYDRYHGNRAGAASTLLTAFHYRQPCGIEYELVGDPEPDSREPYDVHVPAEHRRGEIAQLEPIQTKETVIGMPG
jgi:catechol 2,3-dioxygenase-like lactoylglutathione lyase family enzyme